VTWDTVDDVYSLFPIVLLVTAAVVVLGVGVAFRSVLIPLVSVGTTSLTIAFVFGIADLIYQHGAFNGLHFSGLSGHGGLVWMTPLIAFSVMVGVGLDYNVFLLVRVQEFRQLGLPTSAAIANGLYKTGSIITAAGTIMAIAFCGLLFSAIPSLNQISLYLVVAVLFDTFVVRSLVVPGLLSCLSTLHQDAPWWPQKPTNTGVKF